MPAEKDTWLVLTSTHPKEKKIISGFGCVCEVGVYMASPKVIKAMQQGLV